MGNPTSAARKEIALDYLKRSRADYESATRDLQNAARVRLHYIKLAREYGVTNAAIGEALGIVESAVRGLVERNHY